MQFDTSSLTRGPREKERRREGEREGKEKKERKKEEEEGGRYLFSRAKPGQLPLLRGPSPAEKLDITSGTSVFCKLSFKRPQNFPTPPTDLFS